MSKGENQMNHQIEISEMKQVSGAVENLLGMFNKAADSFTKPAGICLMGAGGLFFALAIIGNFCLKMETFEFTVLVICAVVLLLCGAGIRVYSWRVTMPEAAKTAESIQKIHETSVNAIKDMQSHTAYGQP